MLAGCMLKSSDYTIQNALTWGNCKKHFEKAFETTDLTQRVVNLAIAFFEAFPLIGQVVSLIEMAVASGHVEFQKSDEESSPLLKETIDEESVAIVDEKKESLTLFDHSVSPVQPTETLEAETESVLDETVSTLPSQQTAQYKDLSSTKPSRSVPVESLKQFNRNITPLQPSKDVKVDLPEKKKELALAVSPLHYKLVEQYKDLPWPKSVKKVIYYTKVKGGRGDVMASAKAIETMKKLSPNLEIDWVIAGDLAKSSIVDPKKFLSTTDLSNITVRRAKTDSLESGAADLLVVGPVSCWEADDTLETLLGREVNGASFGYLENASTKILFSNSVTSSLSQKLNGGEILGYNKELHNSLFPSKLFNDGAIGYVAMGLNQGSGVFLDQDRIKTKLSQGYFEPNSLMQIQDQSLRKDVLEYMKVSGDESELDYSQVSFNSGYAHKDTSWGRFIDCVSIHEKQKHVTIVLNQHSHYLKLSTEDFQERVFTHERLKRLKAQGFGSIILKGKDETLLQLDAQDMENPRRLVVIVRPSFLPSDMKHLQLASERLLATGDNSAVEAWCSRCKLYLYEDLDDAGCKGKFLQQQVDIAKKLSPNLSRLLALFGNDKRLSFAERDLEDNWEEVENLLNDPDLSDSTLKLCDHIVSNYSFDKVFESALKRSMWHHILPNLSEIEVEELGDDFKKGLTEYLKDPKSAQNKNFTITDFDELKARIEDAVTEHIEE